MITNLRTYNWINAFRGMRNPKKSWHLNDTCIEYSDTQGEIPFLGPNDLKLSTKLIKAGKDHRKFCRQLFITFDCVGSLKFYDQFSQYKFQITNSTSQMHTSGKFLFTKEDFHNKVWPDTIDRLNGLIEFYRILKTDVKKEVWEEIIYNTPAGYLYKRTVSMSYETFLGMYLARHAHKLQEWVDFCQYLRNNLPYAENWISELSSKNRKDDDEWITIEI